MPFEKAKIDESGRKRNLIHPERGEKTEKIGIQEGTDLYRQGDLYFRYGEKIFLLSFPLPDPYLPSVFRVSTTANLSQVPGTMTNQKQSSVTRSKTFCLRIIRLANYQPGIPISTVACYSMTGAIR
jgi:hypothetical protein